MRLTLLDLYNGLSCRSYIYDLSLFGKAISEEKIIVGIPTNYPYF